jgi:hypothetical protein
MSSTTTRAGPGARTDVPWATDLVVTGAAVICALVMWLTAVQMGGVDPVVAINNEPRRISVVSVVVSAAVAALVGLSVLRCLERFSPRGIRIWSVFALGVAALSALGPLSVTPVETRGTLLGLHGVVAAVVIVGARRSRLPVGTDQAISGGR